MKIGAKANLDKVNFDFMVDWKSNPEETMTTVNEALKERGLEVVMHPTDFNSYAFSIRPIVKKSK